MTEMIPAVDFSPAKAQLSELMTSVVHQHLPRLIQRHGGKEEALLLNPDDLRAMLEHEFIATTAYVDDGEFVVSVPSWGLDGIGPSFDEALNELVEEARLYVADYLQRIDFYLQTNRRSHALGILRFALTPPEQQADVLLSGSASDHASESEFWDAIRTGMPVVRPSETEEGPPQHSAWVLRVLTAELHLTAAEIEGLSMDEGIRIVNEFRSRPRN
jgi:hypothetical protein